MSAINAELDSLELDVEARLNELELAMKVKVVRPGIALINTVTVLNS